MRNFRAMARVARKLLCSNRGTPACLDLAHALRVMSTKLWAVCASTVPVVSGRTLEVTMPDSARLDVNHSPLVRINGLMLAVAA